jgi:pyruvate/2-oxoglutarate dehydrogenase complex dihydrolipoamide dehydrogenase (E3) component
MNLNRGARPRVLIVGAGVDGRETAKGMSRTSSEVVLLLALLEILLTSIF